MSDSQKLSKMEQRIDEERDEGTAPAEKQGLGYCLSCRQTITCEEIEDHEGCPIRLLSSMVAEANEEHAGWKELQSNSSAIGFGSLGSLRNGSR